MPDFIHALTVSPEADQRFDGGRTARHDGADHAGLLNEAVGLRFPARGSIVSACNPLCPLTAKHPSTHKETPVNNPGVSQFIWKGLQPPQT